MAIEDDILALCGVIDGKVDALTTNLAAAKTVIDNIYTAVVTNAAGADIAADIIEVKAVVDSLVLVGAALDEDLSAHTTAGTLGDFVSRVNSQYGLGTP